VKRESEIVIKRMLEQGSYEVDPRRVADAIIARMLGQAPLPPGLRELQNECSNPSSLPVASTNAAAG
jgi:hypothetical protein